MRRPWPIEQSEQIVVVDPGLVDSCRLRGTRSQAPSPFNGFAHCLII
jgi:hypothetical protein